MTQIKNRMNKDKNGKVKNATTKNKENALYIKENMVPCSSFMNSLWQFFGLVQPALPQEELEESKKRPLPKVLVSVSERLK